MPTAIIGIEALRTTLLQATKSFCDKAFNEFTRENAQVFSDKILGFVIIRSVDYSKALQGVAKAKCAVKILAPRNFDISRLEEVCTTALECISAEVAVQNPIRKPCTYLKEFSRLEAELEFDVEISVASASGDNVFWLDENNSIFVVFAEHSMDCKTAETVLFDGTLKASLLYPKPPELKLDAIFPKASYNAVTATLKSLVGVEKTITIFGVELQKLRLKAFKTKITPESDCVLCTLSYSQAV